MIILNEKIYAEECLRSGVIRESPAKTLRILASYYYHEKGYKKSRIIRLLTDFMRVNYQDYDNERSKWDDVIEKAASSAAKYHLVQIDRIDITEYEMEKIQEPKSKKSQRLLFTLLCLAKYNNARNPNNNGWVSMERRDIFKLARVTCSIKERDYMLGDLCDLGYLEHTKRNGNLSIRVCFIHNEGKCVMSVNDMREPGYSYLKYCGEKNIVECRDCGILFRRDKDGKRIYCKDCANYVPMKRKRVVCVDCGEPFWVSSKNTKARRCPNCQYEYRKTYKRNYYLNRKLDSANEMTPYSSTSI